MKNNTDTYGHEDNVKTTFHFDDNETNTNAKMVSSFSRISEVVSAIERNCDRVEN